jgi:hypothetical protein
MGRVPSIGFTGQEGASSALSTYDKYMEFLQTQGLQDLKAKGISPGSITEKEWPKFVARKTSLDRVKSTPEVKAELGRLQVDAMNTKSLVQVIRITTWMVRFTAYRLVPMPSSSPLMKRLNNADTLGS